MRSAKMNLRKTIQEIKAMIILSVIITLGIFFSLNLNAQSYSSNSAIGISGFGIKTFGNFANVKATGISDALPQTKTIDGFDITAFIEIPIQDNFSFQPEISYNKKGFRIKEGLDLKLFNFDIPVGLEAHTELKYVQVPLLGKYTLANEKAGLYFMAGPSLAFATNATLKTKARFIIDFNITQTDIDLSNDDFNRFELAALGGMGGFVNIGSARLFAEMRYHWGLTDLMADPIVDVHLKNRVLGLGAGLQFQF